MLQKQSCIRVAELDSLHYKYSKLSARNISIELDPTSVQNDGIMMAYKLETIRPKSGLGILDPCQNIQQPLVAVDGPG